MPNGVAKLKGRAEIILLRKRKHVFSLGTINVTNQDLL